MSMIRQKEINVEQLADYYADIPCAVAAFALDGTDALLFANDEFYRAVGYTPDEYALTIAGNDQPAKPSAPSGEIADATADRLTGDSSPLPFPYGDALGVSALRGSSNRQCCIARKSGDSRWVSISAKDIVVDGRSSILCFLQDITAQKKFDAAIRAENEHSQDAMNNVSGGLVKVQVNDDGTSEPVFMNRAFLDMTQMTFEQSMELYRKDSCAGVHPDDVERVRARMQDFRVGEVVNDTFRLRCGSNGWIWVRVTVSIKAENGHMMLYNNYLDVTDEHENSVMIEGLLNNLPGGVAIFKVGKHLECQYVNELGAQNTGWDRSELIASFNRPGFLKQIIHPTDYPELVEMIQHCAQSGDPVNITMRYLQKNGNTKWLHLAATKMREEDGCPVYYCVFTTPAEQSILYQRIAEESIIGIAVSDVDTHEVLYVNKALRKMMHIESDQYVGKKCYKYIRGGSCACEGCAARVLSMGETRESVEFFPEFGTYLRVRSIMTTWGGHRALMEYDADVTIQYRERLRQSELLERDSVAILVFNVTKDYLIDFKTSLKEGFSIPPGTNGSDCAKMIGKLGRKEDYANIIAFVEAQRNADLFDGEVMEQALEFRLRTHDGCLR